MQPDLGMTLLITTIWIFQLIITGIPILFFILLIFVIPILILLAYNFYSHVYFRINNFLEGTNFQANQALKLFNDAGFFGKGIGEGSLKNNLPDAHTDFIFSVIAEEFGLIICFLIILMIKQKSNLDLVLYSLIALNFLILGISLPMIDIEARIKVMEFKLLRENISFINQVLYFKSKSVLEMAKLMLTQNEIKIILVGLLVLIFSVVFPLIKIISTILILYSKKIKEAGI